MIYYIIYTYIYIHILYVLYIYIVNEIYKPILTGNHTSPGEKKQSLRLG